MILFNGFQAKEIDFQPLINTYNLLSAVLIHIEPFIVPSIGGAPVVDWREARGSVFQWSK